MTDYEHIWLEPDCTADAYEGRLWAPDDPFERCAECTCAGATKYIRADLHEALATENAELKRQLDIHKRALEKALATLARPSDTGRE